MTHNLGSKGSDTGRYYEENGNGPWDCYEVWSCSCGEGGIFYFDHCMYANDKTGACGDCSDCVNYAEAVYELNSNHPFEETV